MGGGRGRGKPDSRSAQAGLTVVRPAPPSRLPPPFAAAGNTYFQANLGRQEGAGTAATALKCAGASKQFYLNQAWTLPDADFTILEYSFYTDMYNVVWALQQSSFEVTGNAKIYLDSLLSVYGTVRPVATIVLICVFHSGPRPRPPAPAQLPTRWYSWQPGTAAP